MQKDSSIKVKKKQKYATNMARFDTFQDEIDLTSVPKEFLG